MKTYSSSPGRNEKQNLISCPVCYSSQYKAKYMIGLSKFVTCRNCSLVYQNPQPILNDLIERYDKDYFSYEIENENSFLALMLKGLEDVNLNIEEGRGKHFLDVGCATGALLESLAKNGWKTQGIEVCKESVDYAQNKRGLTVFCGTLEQWDGDNNSLDIFHSSHVIEHLVDPISFIRNGYELLKPGGSFICTTPNISGFQSLLMGKKWRSLIEDHLVLFTAEHLMKLIEKQGFSISSFKTWGGLAEGIGPSWLKALLDKQAKKRDFGDVMIIRAVKPK